MPFSDPTIDDYRAAQIVIDRFSYEAVRQAWKHIDHLSDVGDQEGVAHWMGVLAAIQGLQRMNACDGVMH